MTPLSKPEFVTVSRAIQIWVQCNGSPLCTPGPEGLFVPPGESSKHSEENLRTAELVNHAMRDLWRRDHASPVTMSRLVKHVYEDGCDLTAFRLSTNPVSCFSFPPTLQALGFSPAALLEYRLHTLYRAILRRLVEFEIETKESMLS